MYRSQPWTCWVFAEVRDGDRKVGGSGRGFTTTAAMKRQPSGFRNVSEESAVASTISQAGRGRDRKGSVDPWRDGHKGWMARFPRGLRGKTIDCFYPWEILAAAVFNGLKQMMALCTTPDQAPKLLSVRFHRFTTCSRPTDVRSPNAKVSLALKLDCMVLVYWPVVFLFFPLS